MNHIYVLDDSAVVYSDSPYIQLGLRKSEKLRPQCHQLLLLLIECKKVNCVATFDMIGAELWSEDGGWGSDKKQSLKDCVREINKTFKCVENVRGTGYVLASKVLHLPSVPIYSLGRHTTRGWDEYALENLELKQLEISRLLEYITLQVSKLLKDISEYSETIKKLEDGFIKNIITEQLIRLKFTVEALQKHIPLRSLRFKELSDRTEAILKRQRASQDKQNYEICEQIRSLKFENDSLFEWCIEAKFELDRDIKILLEYSIVKTDE